MKDDPPDLELVEIEVEEIGEYDEDSSPEEATIYSDTLDADYGTIAIKPEHVNNTLQSEYTIHRFCNTCSTVYQSEEGCINCLGNNSQSKIAGYLRTQVDSILQEDSTTTTTSISETSNSFSESQQEHWYDECIEILLKHVGKYYVHFLRKKHDKQTIVFKEVIEMCKGFMPDMTIEQVDTKYRDLKDIFSKYENQCNLSSNEYIKPPPFYDTWLKATGKAPIDMFITVSNTSELPKTERHVKKKKRLKKPKHFYIAQQAIKNNLSTKGINYLQPNHTLMPRRQPYDAEMMMQAIDDVKKNNISYRSASFKYGIPKSTLREKVLGKSTVIRNERPHLVGFLKVIEDYSELEFFHYFRLTKPTFDFLYNIVKDLYKAGNLNQSGPIPVEAKPVLYMTLWYLGNITTFNGIAKLFGLSSSFTHKSINTMVDIICSLGQRFIKWPTEEEAQTDAGEFKKISNFPGVIGALGSCHIESKVRCYINRTSKKTFSVNLLAICDSRKKIIFTEVGFPGSTHDNSVLERTSFYTALKEEPENLFPSEFYHVIADEAFQLGPHVLVPFENTGILNYHQQRYNDTLYTTRVVIDHSFAMLKARFRRLSMIELDVDNRVTHYIMSACVLHNLVLDFTNDENMLLNEDEVVNFNEEPFKVMNVNLDVDFQGRAKRNYIMTLL